ncbi:NAD(P)H-hydrate dehydratase [bacterium]|nr:NAD(P)H-hydrate dehydratase [bacterium]
MKIPERLKETHKGDYGHLLVLGGSTGLTGAVCLTANAALRSGCGLVTVGIPESLNDILEVKLTEAMSLPLPETATRTFSKQAVKPCLKFINEKVDGIVIGPGISTNIETADFVKQVIMQAGKPVVIDADALKIVSEEKDILKNLKFGSILTPHPGEMGYLTSLKTHNIQKCREKVGRDFAKENSTVVVLKGARTIVTDGQQLYVNLTGNPGMASAGSGDVLAGIIGSFLVQGLDYFEAGKLGVYIHGLAGDFATKEKGEISLIASDIIEYLPVAFGFIKNI